MNFSSQQYRAWSDSTDVQAGSVANCYLDFNTYTLLKGNLDENLNLSSQQCRAWSDCTDMHAGLELYAIVPSVLIGNTNTCYCSHSVD